MSKRSRQFKKKFRRHLATYLKIAGVVVVLGVVIWVALQPEENVNTPSWDGTKSALMGVSYDETYEEAMEMIAAGKKKDARELMDKMAPLSEGRIKPRGYALAHIWMAKDLLGGFRPKFLNTFPLEARHGTPSKVPYTLPKEEKSQLAQRHLEHAISLDPELGEAPLALSAVWIARGKRASAMEVMIRAIAHKEHPHPELQVPFSNLLTYAGDDLEMEDKAWYSLTVLGRSVAGTSRENAGERMEYALNALILKKYDNVASVIRKMERDFSNAKRFPHAVASIHGLKVAVAYRKAVLLASDAASKSESEANTAYEAVVNALGEVLTIDPGNISVINALSTLAKSQPELQERIKGILGKSAQTKPSSSGTTTGGSAARSHLLLSALSGSDAKVAKKHLEAAVLSSPDDADALIGLAGLLIKEPQPDFARVGKLATDAIDSKKRQGAAKIDPDYYRIQGEALLASGKWEPSIVSLETVLSTHPDQKSIHQLLAKAYQAAGQLELAQKHQAKATGK